MKFRYHFVSAVIVGFLVAGNPHEIWTPDGLFWLPVLAAMMVWGPWFPPLNMAITLVVFSGIAGLQTAKVFRPEYEHNLRMPQVVAWWGYWLLFGMAERFGRYVGP